MASLKKIMFGINYNEATFEKRGFEKCDPAVQAHLENIVKVFMDGYHIAIEEGTNHEKIVERLESTYDAHHIGFAYEGTGMYYSMLDLFMPSKVARMREFTDGAANKHDYIVAVGAGFAVARVPLGLRRMEKYMLKLDPELAWCVPDGYGFHEGIFHHKEFIDKCKPPPSLMPDFTHDIFDSGIGRAMWWAFGARPERIKEGIDKFPDHRKSELWGGIGLAMTYAGGIDEATALKIRDLAGDYVPDFLAGIPFATRMRQKGGNESEWSSHICQTMLGLSADDASNRIISILEAANSKWGGDETLQRRGNYKEVRNLLKAEFGSVRT